MDDHDYVSGRFAERWHGWGAPVGAGIALLSLGGFLVLLARGLVTHLLRRPAAAS